MRLPLRTRIALVGVSVWAVLMMTGCPAPSDIVFFRDSGLEAAIRVELGQPLGLLSKSDLLRLTKLDARSRGIRDLSGLEFATELQQLDLDTNQVSNITALGNLTKLEVLVLDSNEIFDLGPLQGLLEIRALSLFDNQVADIKALVANAEVPGGWGDRPGVQVILDIRTLSDEALNVDVPRLRQLGVNVVLVQEAESS